ncbi:MAG: sugar ABC transporter permease [Fimbriimonadaceae bacterium]|uniref:Spermidine/putrescine ABC transporter permease n=1 Tax=Candidatus Nitrosymbiomonas proteolyticus TaxID=2608984 RepID=A0A809S2V9_9BACT|nr:sugar ABC transporter permease [Fimbriimonadaceae bacterium]NUM37640.1 sugar ABC transporter permease [Armatimonadota bacterium]BBO22816.1 spermidine/putrescine ABC transporter permease [Candidatus Nitrosymbiomonas proteolyticus]
MSLLRRRESRLGWLFVAPATLHLVVFALFPMGFALYISLFKWRLFKDSPEFVFLQNYVWSFTEGPFWNALWNSFRYTAVSVPAGMAVALGVALLVNQKLRGVTIFRTLYYIPAISSGVAVSMLWIYVFLPETGMLNLLLRMIGVSSIAFLQDSTWAMWALAFMSIWTGLGPKMVLYLAGLVGIPQSLYEAAELDGAGKLRSFWSVTLPMLAPTTIFVLITSTIGAMQVFTPVYMMTKGGPENSTDVVGYHIYTEAWVNFNTGLASAKSFVLLVIIGGISLLQFRLMRRQLEGYSAS